MDASDRGGGLGIGGMGDIDMQNVEEVAGHASKATLSSMQQLWRSHGVQMDAKGRSAAEVLFTLHAQAIKVCVESQINQSVSITASTPEKHGHC